MSQITTHVLDTASGLPAAGVPIQLYSQQDDAWEVLATGVTNSDGRIGGLLSDERVLPAGIYRMHFDTTTYFQVQNSECFYPYVDIVFQIGGDGDHYHIPLLLAPFAYSTYRGS